MGIKPNDQQTPDPNGGSVGPEEVLSSVNGLVILPRVGARRDSSDCPVLPNHPILHSARPGPQVGFESLLQRSGLLLVHQD